jgi:phage repressor protein C with HTH and peptisase S24 domain
MEPTLKSGSLIFVNPIENEGDTVRDGAIYVIMCGNTMLVKRIKVNPITKAYTLISDHPAHDNDTVKNWAESGCKFVGRVVGSFDRV